MIETYIINDRVFIWLHPSELQKKVESNQREMKKLSSSHRNGVVKDIRQVEGSIDKHDKRMFSATHVAVEDVDRFLKDKSTVYSMWSLVLNWRRWIPKMMRKGLQVLAMRMLISCSTQFLFSGSVVVESSL